MNRYEEIATNLGLVQERISNSAQLVGRQPEEITLIAVTKNFPVSDAQILYDLGVRNMGENRDQEGSLKSEQLPLDIRWHFQGQIQGRKIKSVGSWAQVVHSLDSLEHARKFDELEESRVEDFFIQINLEPGRLDRGGISVSQLPDFLTELRLTTELSLSGLMMVAPITAPAELSFNELRSAREVLVQSYPAATALSMGMSGDFEAAIVAGATHVRIGSSILGSRGLLA